MVLTRRSCHWRSVDIVQGWVLVVPDDEQMWLTQTVQLIQIQPNTMRKLPQW